MGLSSTTDSDTLYLGFTEYIVNIIFVCIDKRKGFIIEQKFVIQDESLYITVNFEPIMEFKNILRFQLSIDIWYYVKKKQTIDWNLGVRVCNFLLEIIIHLLIQSIIQVQRCL